MTTTITDSFGVTPLTDQELPTFLSRAAERALRRHRRDWKKKDFNPHNSPGFSPTPVQARQVAKLAALGLSVAEISLILCIEKSLLKFYYDYEIKTSKLRTNASVAKVALEMALDGQHETMTKFWLKSQAGWKERDVVEHEGLDAAADEAKAARAKLLSAD